jgi:hypothetical protein
MDYDSEGKLTLIQETIRHGNGILTNIKDALVIIGACCLAGDIMLLIIFLKLLKYI